MMNADKELDARGLNCPLPILKAKKALADMTSGQVLRVISTDAGSVRDFQDRPGPREVIEHCLMAAGTAPSGANQQPWHFAVIGDPLR